jgi:16S rRNA (cytosine967-C5)-methyltransferase
VVSSSSERRAAALALIRVEQGAFASRLLQTAAGPGVRARVLGVLRWLSALDWVLRRHVRSGLERLDPEVRAVLRLGLYEAVHLGVPAPVATDAAVRLVAGLGKGSARGLVNAVLRRAIAGNGPSIEEAPEHVRWCHPRWLVRRWSAAFGEQAAARIMAADQEPAPLWAWLADPDARQRLDVAGTRLEAHPWCPGAWRAPDDPGALAAAVAGGDAYAQDPASQLVAHVAARLLDELPDATPHRCADLCSAPGGKAALLARLRPGIDLVCLDLQPTRVRLVQRLLDRLVGPGRRQTVAAADAGAPPLAGESLDLVVLDAPCSGTGTLRRHPELRWRLSAPELERLAAAQARLVAAAIELLAPGGVLLYSTCSIEPEENERVVAGALGGSQARLETVGLASLVPASAGAITTPAGGLRLLPAGLNDGFTLHALRRETDTIPSGHL